MTLVVLGLLLLVVAWVWHLGGVGRAALVLLILAPEIVLLAVSVLRPD